MPDDGQQHPASNSQAGPTPSGSGWTAGRVIAMVLAGIGALIALVLVVGGLAVLAVYAFGRDDDGYFTSGRERLASPAYAITTQQIDLGADDVDWAPDAVLGDVRVRVYSGRTPAFIGIARDADVERYLAGVAHDELDGFDGGRARFLRQAGGEAPGPPGDQDFWVARSEGSGRQSLTWDAEFGRWAVVVMNADAARGIDVEADAGVKLSWGVWVGLGLLVAGLLLGVVAAAVIGLLGRSAHAAARRSTGATAA